MSQAPDQSVKAANRANVIAALALLLTFGATLWSNRLTERSVKLAEDSLVLSTKQYEDARKERTDASVPKVVIKSVASNFFYRDPEGHAVPPTGSFASVVNAGSIPVTDVEVVWLGTDADADVEKLQPITLKPDDTAEAARYPRWLGTRLAKDRLVVGRVLIRYADLAGNHYETEQRFGIVAGRLRLSTDPPLPPDPIADAQASFTVYPPTHVGRPEVRL